MAGTRGASTTSRSPSRSTNCSGGCRSRPSRRARRWRSFGTSYASSAWPSWKTATTTRETPPRSCPGISPQTSLGSPGTRLAVVGHWGATGPGGARPADQSRTSGSSRLRVLTAWSVYWPGGAGRRRHQAARRLPVAVGLGRFLVLRFALLQEHPPPAPDAGSAARPVRGRWASGRPPGARGGNEALASQRLLHHPRVQLVTDDLPTGFDEDLVDRAQIEPPSVSTWRPVIFTREFRSRRRGLTRIQA